MDIESLVVEGVTAVKEGNGSELWGKVVSDPLFMCNLDQIFGSSLPLLMLSIDKRSVTGVFLICKLVFEIGRLTGRSELIRETMGE